MNFSKKLSSGAALLTFALLPLRLFAATPAPENLLPDDTLVVFTAPDFVKLGDAIKKAPQSQLWNDPALKPFKEKFVAQWKNEIVDPLEKELGIKFADYTTLLQGQLTFAVTQDGWKGREDHPPGGLLLVDAKGKADQLKKNLAELRKKWVSAGKTLRTEKIRDVELSVVQVSSNDVPKTLRNLVPKSSEVHELGEENSEKKSEDKDELVIGQADSLLIVATSLTAAEKVVTRLKGGSAPALADVASYQANHTAMFRDSPLYGWINVKRFMDILIPIWSEKKENPDAPNPFDIAPEKVLNALGLTALKTVAFSVQYAADGGQFQAFLSVPESSRQGLFKILAGEAKETLPPAFVPADAVKYQRWRISGSKAWATLEKTLSDISPQAASTLNFLLDSANTYAKEKDSAFDIRKNLIGNLGDDIVSYQKAPRGQELASIASPPSIVLVGSPNPEQLVGSLKSILVFMSQQSGGEPQDREFLGRKIYSVALNLPGQAARADGKPTTLSYAATSGYVALSTDAAMVEEYLRVCDSQPKPLRENSALTDASQKVLGPNTTLFGYQNDAENMRTAIELLKNMFGSGSKSAASALGPLAAELPSPDKIKEWVDFSLLPPYEKISKYFGITVYSFNATVDGLSFKTFTPVPSGLKK